MAQKNPILKTALLACVAGMLAACMGMPEKVTPVQGFELERYLGKWYEIARLDHSFERGLSNVTAEYSLREDGGVNVVNRGYSSEEGEWKQARGKADFVDSADSGHLKVSFFGPFYSSYVVFGLDRDGYQYAFVSGFNTSYLWLLARSPEVPAAVLEEFRRQATAKGFDLDELIMVEHEQR